MCNPRIIKIELRANLGILTFKPDSAAIDIIIIGPSIQAKGILKESATIALGIEIKITKRNFLEISCLKFEKFKVSFINKSSITNL